VLVDFSIYMLEDISFEQFEPMGGGPIISWNFL